jgi:hypothetical protein
MDLATIIAPGNFTVTGPGPTAVPGAVSYASRTAVFTPTAVLTPSTDYKVTITTAVTDVPGTALSGNQGVFPATSSYVWTFRTGIAPDTTRPRVTITVPVTTTPGPTTGVATNTAISAAFTEPMNPLTLTAASFTLTGPGVTPVLGSVTYASQVAVFVPTATLAAGITYTATVTTIATDLAGNALAGNLAALPAASNYQWTFTTAAVVVTPPKITLTNPIDQATGVLLNSAVNANFSEAMNPTTLSIATFTVQPEGPPLGALVLGSVTYNPVANIATFTPTSPLTGSTKYRATVTIGAKDLAGDALVAGLIPNPWTFTTAAAGLAPGAVPLGSASTFGIMATSSISSTGFTIINGDVALDPGTSMTGFPPAVVNGNIHVNDTAAALAYTDLLTAYNFAKALPPGTTISGGADLGALYPLGIPPGTYTSGSTMLVSTHLTLDAGGNANAVWVFQIGSSLTTSADVSLANGAQAKNVFWVPTASATIGVNTTFSGTIVAGVSATGVTGATINGRILAGAIGPGSIALDTNTVNVPAP